MALEFAGVMNSMVDVILQVVIWGGSALLICGIIIGVVYLNLYFKRFKYTIVVIKRVKSKFKDEVGVEHATTSLVWVGLDKGAILKDRKTKKVFLVLKKANFRMEPEFETIPKESGGQAIFVEKVGYKQYVYLKPVSVEGDINFSITREDVADAMVSFDRNAALYKPGISQWLPIIGIGIFGVIVIVLIAMILNKFDILAEVASKLEGTAKIIAEAKQSAVSSDVVVPLG